MFCKRCNAAVEDPKASICPLCHTDLVASKPAVSGQRDVFESLPYKIPTLFTDASRMQDAPKPQAGSASPSDEMLLDLDDEITHKEDQKEPAITSSDNEANINQLFDASDELRMEAAEPSNGFLADAETTTLFSEESGKTETNAIQEASDEPFIPDETFEDPLSDLELPLALEVTPTDGEDQTRDLSDAAPPSHKEETLFDDEGEMLLGEDFFDNTFEEDSVLPAPDLPDPSDPDMIDAPTKVINPDDIRNLEMETDDFLDSDHEDPLEKVQMAEKEAPLPEEPPETPIIETKDDDVPLTDDPVADTPVDTGYLQEIEQMILETPEPEDSVLPEPAAEPSEAEEMELAEDSVPDLEAFLGDDLEQQIYAQIDDMLKDAPEKSEEPLKTEPDAAATEGTDSRESLEEIDFSASDLAATVPPSTPSDETVKGQQIEEMFSPGLEETPADLLLETDSQRAATQTSTDEQMEDVPGRGTTESPIDDLVQDVSIRGTTEASIDELVQDVSSRGTTEAPIDELVQDVPSRGTTEAPIDELVQDVTGRGSTEVPIDELVQDVSSRASTAQPIDTMMDDASGHQTAEEEIHATVGVHAKTAAAVSAPKEMVDLPTYMPDKPPMVSSRGLFMVLTMMLLLVSALVGAWYLFNEALVKQDTPAPPTPPAASRTAPPAQKPAPIQTEATVAKPAIVSETPQRPSDTGTPETVLAQAATPTTETPATLPALPEAPPTPAGTSLESVSAPPAQDPSVAPVAVLFEQETDRSAAIESAGPPPAPPTAETPPAAPPAAEIATNQPVTQKAILPDPQPKVTPEPTHQTSPVQNSVDLAPNWYAFDDSGNPFWTIQLETHRDSQKVAESLAGLRQSGYPGYVVVKQNRNGVPYFQLRVGQYGSKRKALEAAGPFHSRELREYIIVRSLAKIAPTE